MKKKLQIILILSIISNLNLLSQNNDTWISFWNQDSTLFGYKDKNGIVKIEPKFIVNAGKRNFENIIAVSENKEKYWVGYYLTKSGNIVGRDSMFFYDNGFDCENEGFIRFKDHNIDKVGIFDRTGKIVVPAIYNYLSIVRNGMIEALIGAEKKYDEGGEHYFWIGGQYILIDTNNKILIDNFKLDIGLDLNFYSLEISKKPHQDTTRKSFLAVDGSYYSFVDFEKEFSEWIFKELQSDLTLDRLISISYDSVELEQQDGWINVNKEKLNKDNLYSLKNELLQILDPKTEYFFSCGWLISDIIKEAEIEKYFDNCGDLKYWIYPEMTIVIWHGDITNRYQNQIEFLRTDQGYKLIRIPLLHKN